MDSLWSSLKESLLFWLGVALVCCGAIFGAWGWHLKELDSRFANEGVRAEGKILEKKQEKNRDSDDRYLLRFSYPDDKGKSFEAWQALPPEPWSRYLVGEQVGVTYLRSAPSKARLENASANEDGRGQLKFSFAAFVVGAVSVILGVRQARQLKKRSAATPESAV